MSRKTDTAIASDATYAQLATIGSIDRMLWPKGEELQRLAQSGKEMQNLDQIELLPLESTKLRLTMQSDEPGVVVKLRE